MKTTGQKLWSNYSVKECLLKNVPFSRTHFLFLWLTKFLAIFKDCVCLKKRKALKKLWNVHFISPKMLFSLWRYSNFCNFLSFVHRFKVLRGSWIRGIYDVIKYLHKLSVVTFWITQKQFWIKASKWVR